MRRTDLVQGFQDSLLFPGMNDRRYGITTASVKTVQWLLQDPIYSAWQALQNGMLWIKGKPGSGKSTLMKYALGQEMIAQESEGFLLIPFFFNARGSELQHTLPGFFRLLLYYLIDHIDVLRSGFLSHCRLKRSASKDSVQTIRWDLDELRELASSFIIQALEKTHIKIYVDALDECGEPSAIDLASFFDELLSRPNQPSILKKIHICISCRHYPIIDYVKGLQINVERSNTNAITTYVDQKLQRPSVGSDLAEMASIERDIIDRSLGVFQWVVLVLRIAMSLNKAGHHPRRIRQRISELPSELDDLYSDILQMIQDHDRSRVSSLIRWVYLAVRPLSLSEISVAMAFDTEIPCPSLQAWKDSLDYVESDRQMDLLITSLSGGLVEVAVSGESAEAQPVRIVQFIHESVNDYIRSKGLSALTDSPSPGFFEDGHYRTSRACLNYIKTAENLKLADDRNVAIGRDSSVTDQLTRKVFKVPFLRYAGHYLWTHLTLARNNEHLQEDLSIWLALPSEEVFRAIMCLSCKEHDSLSPDPWLTEDNHVFRPERALPLIHVMCCLNMDRIVLELLEHHGMDANSRDSMGFTPLMVASQYGGQDIVRYLVGYPTVEMNLRNYYGQTALHLAARHNTVEPFVADQKVDVNVKDNDGRTPLFHAVRYGSAANVRDLLGRTDVDVNAIDCYHRTVLHHLFQYASPNSRENEEKLRYLLAHANIDVNKKDEENLTPLAMAMESRDENLARALRSHPLIYVNHQVKPQVKPKDSHDDTRLRPPAMLPHTEQLLQLFLAR